MLEGLSQEAKVQLVRKLRAKILAFATVIEAGADRLPKPEEEQPEYDSDDEVRQRLEQQ